LSFDELKQFLDLYSPLINGCPFTLKLPLFVSQHIHFSSTFQIAVILDVVAALTVAAATSTTLTLLPATSITVSETAFAVLAKIIESCRIAHSKTLSFEP
jgi:hypothetical protein